MDIKSEMAGLQARLSTMVAKAEAAGRDLTAAEVTEIEETTARVLLLKGSIERGEKAAGIVDSFTAGGELVNPFGADGGHQVRSDARGYMTPAGIKATAQATADQGQKSLAAGGSVITPIALETAPIPLGQSGLGLLSLIPTRVRQGERYSYLRQSLRQNNAAVVEAGETKPTSNYEVATVEGALKTFAHLSAYVGKYVLRDNTDLVTWLDASMRQGVVRAVTADAVQTILTTNGIQTEAYASSAADSIWRGMSKLTSLGYNVETIVLNQIDYDQLRLAKDSNGQYLGQNFLESVSVPGVWGVQTVVSPDVPEGKAIVLGAGSVNLSVDAAGVETEADAISGFATNEVRFRTEMRAATDVTQPEAIVLVTTKAA